MANTQNNKTIAKNTMFLYFRMMFTMLISLYTSRVILEVLGVDDFGTYQTVGGIVTMLSFVNGALSTGSSRFLTFELGRKDKDRLKKTFSSVLTVHIILALIIVLLAETVGLWIVYNKLTLTPDRFDAAIFAYHMSVVASLFTITQVPYSASIISHERMNIYAYMSIIEVILKLVVVYLLKLGSFDKLILYSILLAIVNISIAVFYRCYVIHFFEESHYKFMWDKSIIKKILSYSGWNLLANTSIALNNQGAIVLLNIFFSPAIVSARAIANQVNMAAHQFINNFRTAANPQIIKRYAAGDIEGSKRLLLSSTKYSYYMMLLLCLPICLVADILLEIWLTEVPESTVAFLRLAIITSLFQVFDSSFYTALYAKGQIRENALTGPLIALTVFPVVYVLFKFGMSPMALAWALLVLYIILGMVQKPILIVKIAGYKYSEIFEVFACCFKVSLVSLPIPLFVYYVKERITVNSILVFFILTCICILSVACSIWYIGIDKTVRNSIKSFVLHKIHHAK